ADPQVLRLDTARGGRGGDEVSEGRGATQRARADGERPAGAEERPAVEVRQYSPVLVGHGARLRPSGTRPGAWPAATGRCRGSRATGSPTRRARVRRSRAGRSASPRPTPRPHRG